MARYHATNWPVTNISIIDTHVPGAMWTDTIDGIPG